MGDRSVFLAGPLHSYLKPLGFRRRRNVWNRSSGEFIDVVDVQPSKSLTHVWVNLGVIDPEIYRICWQEKTPGFVVEPRCTVRERLGILADGHDTFWELEDPDASAKVLSLMSTFGVPFLDRMHSREAQLFELGSRPLLPPNVMYAAILMSKLGRRNDACQTLATYEAKGIGAWVTRAKELRAELECSRRGDVNQ